MLAAYKKFCCGIFYLLRDKARSDIPFFATFMFTLLLFQLLVYCIQSLYRIFIDTSFSYNAYEGLLISFIFGIPNYFFVFRNEKFMEYYKGRMRSRYVLLIIA